MDVKIAADEQLRRALCPGEDKQLQGAVVREKSFIKK